MNRIYITVFLLGLLINFSSCKNNELDSKKLSKLEQKLAKLEPLHHEIKMPEITTNEPSPLLILLHGLGSNEKDMANLGKSLDPRCIVVSVRAPYKLSEGKYSWYEYKRRGTERTYSFSELQSSRIRIMNLINDMLEQHNIDEDKIIVGGFSQGAMMGLATSLKYSELIDGAMVLSGDLLDEVEVEMEDLLIHKGLDVYMSHGRQDKVLPFAEAVKDIKSLKAKGVDVYEYYYDAAHTISQENFVSLSDWLKGKIDD